MKKLIKHILDGILTLLPAIGTLASSKMIAEKIHEAIEGSTMMAGTTLEDMIKPA